MQEVKGGDRASKAEAELVNRHRSVTARKRPNRGIGLPKAAPDQLAGGPIVQSLGHQIGPVECQVRLIPETMGFDEPIGITGFRAASGARRRGI